jgi:hypothetical protein
MNRERVAWYNGKAQWVCRELMRLASSCVGAMKQKELAILAKLPQRISVPFPYPRELALIRMELAYLPTTYLFHDANVFHSSMRTVVAPLVDAGKNGVVMQSGDGLCVDVIPSWSPEQVLVTTAYLQWRLSHLPLFTRGRRACYEAPYSGSCLASCVCR